MSRRGKQTRASWEAAPNEPFISVLRSTTKEPAWKHLSFGARCLFFLVRSFYNGANNGRIYLSARKAADELGASKNSVTKWFRELEDHGFIRPTERGCLGLNGEGQATYWRLTEVGYLGERPTREFREWAEKNEIPSQKMHDPSQKLGSGVTKNGTGKTKASQKMGRIGANSGDQASQKVGHSTVPYGSAEPGGEADAA